MLRCYAFFLPCTLPRQHTKNPKRIKNYKKKSKKIKTRFDFFQTLKELQKHYFSFSVAIDFNGTLLTISNLGVLFFSVAIKNHVFMFCQIDERRCNSQIPILGGADFHKTSLYFSILRIPFLHHCKNLWIFAISQN